MSTLPTRKILPTFLLLAAVGAAQNTTVFPTDFANREGNLAESFGPLSNGIARTLILYDRRDLPIPSGRTITHVGFRQERNRASTGRAIQLAVYMGGTPRDYDGMSRTFANNYDGTPRTLVFGPAIVNLPDFTSQTTNAPFDIVLDNAFTMPNNENLLVEFVVSANNNANQSFSWTIDEGSFYTEVQSVGTGCATSAGQVPALSVSNRSFLGSNLDLSLSNAPASSMIFLNLDTQRTTPIDATPFGAPGCTLYVLPNVTFQATGNTSGSASFRFRLPDDPTLFRATLYSQSAIFDLFANRLGFAFSNGAETTLGIRPLAAQLSATGNASATTGSVESRAAPITRFQWN